MWEHIVNRQQGILNFNDELIHAIGKTRVLVVGAGGNGAVLDFLVRVGYRHFVIVDFDVVEATNLNRLPFTMESIGTTKTEAWTEYLKKVNPECSVTAYSRKVTRDDEKWVEEIIAGVDIVALGTTDIEANFLISRVCHRLRRRMVVGPGTANCLVVSTFTHEGDASLESVAGFGTENVDVREIDYQSLLPKYMRLYMFPGRTEKLYPETLQKVRNREIPPRNCKIFVSMVNAAASWEIVKNTAVINGITLRGTNVVEFPLIQVFDPFKGSAYYYDAGKDRIGIPNWLTGKIRWYPVKR
ncbi:MAG: ThiF family adenylyltransferase [Deltaproteobacteria bacterium]|nr:ThiF family adenylyltransferase [Deltaproteobacteria bacterium]